MAQDWKEILAGMAPSAPAPLEVNEGNAKPENETPKKTPDTIHVLIDRKGRKGKVATIIEGFTLPDDEVAEIASELKRKIGTGGSSRGGEILLQGDWRDRAISLLKDLGYRVK